MHTSRLPHAAPTPRRQIQTLTVSKLRKLIGPDRCKRLRGRVASHHLRRHTRPHISSYAVITRTRHHVACQPPAQRLCVRSGDCAACELLRHHIQLVTCRSTTPAAGSCAVLCACSIAMPRSRSRSPRRRRDRSRSHDRHRRRHESHSRRRGDSRDRHHRRRDGHRRSHSHSRSRSPARRARTIGGDAAPQAAPARAPPAVDSARPTRRSPSRQAGAGYAQARPPLEEQHGRGGAGPGAGGGGGRQGGGEAPRGISALLRGNDEDDGTGWGGSDGQR